MPKPTAAERRATIKARLAAAETPQKEVSRNVVQESKKEEPAKTVEQSNDDALKENEENIPETPSTPRPSSRSISNRVTEQRHNKPVNYKIHVITALGLAIAIRTLALGAKAVIGGK